MREAVLRFADRQVEQLVRQSFISGDDIDVYFGHPWAVFWPCRS